MGQLLTLSQSFLDKYFNLSLIVKSDSDTSDLKTSDAQAAGTILEGYVNEGYVEFIDLDIRGGRTFRGYRIPHDEDLYFELEAMLGSEDRWMPS